MSDRLNAARGAFLSVVRSALPHTPLLVLYPEDAYAPEVPAPGRPLAHPATAEALAQALAALERAPVQRPAMTPEKRQQRRESAIAAAKRKREARALERAREGVE